jgi:hypothetical protein
MMAPPDAEPCANPTCGAPAPPRRCSRCRAASYCDAACQRAGWRAGHKDVCAPPPLAIAPRAAPATTGVAREHPCRCVGSRCTAYPRRACAGCGLAFVCDKKRCVREHRAACKDILGRRVPLLAKAYPADDAKAIGARVFAPPISAEDAQELLDIVAGMPDEVERVAERFGEIARAVRAKLSEGLSPTLIAGLVEAVRWCRASTLSTRVLMSALEVYACPHGLALRNGGAPIPAGGIVSEFPVGTLTWGRAMMGPFASEHVKEPLAVLLSDAYRNNLDGDFADAATAARRRTILNQTSAVFRPVLVEEFAMVDDAALAQSLAARSTISDPAVGGPGNLAHFANDGVDLATLVALAAARLSRVKHAADIPPEFLAEFRHAYWDMPAVRRNNATSIVLVDDCMSTLRTFAVATRPIAAGEEVLLGYGWRYWFVPAVREAYPELAAQLDAPAFVQRLRDAPIV